MNIMNLFIEKEMRVLEMIKLKSCGTFNTNRDEN